MYQHLRSSVRSLTRSFSKSLRKRRQPARAKVRRELLALEPLEDRKVMDASPTVVALDTGNAAIADNGTITVKAGSPLQIPLDGDDVDGGALTYEITSSNTSVITATKSAAANKWAKITVAGFGEMLFQLFDDKASRVTGHFEQLSAPNGYYNRPTNSTNTGANAQFDNFDNTFHRVAKGFVIQGGDRENGTGNGGSELGDFDDQFSLDLQHNRRGILSMAKSDDDTNDSQFFITARDTRDLDFNHSVFGVLVEGEDVRAAIDAVTTGGAQGTTPNTPVKITSIEIIDDTQNDVMLLKPAAGVTSGSSVVTVRVTDPEGNVTTRTFNVQVVADVDEFGSPVNGSPFLNDVPDQTATAGVAKNVQLSTQDAEGDAVTYILGRPGTQQTNPIPAIDEGASAGTATISASGLLTVTPAAGFTGTLHVNVFMKQSGTAPDTTDPSGDFQKIAFTVTAPAPSAPSSVVLAASSDSGVSNSDKVTNATSLSFVVSGVTAGNSVKLFDGSTEIGAITAQSSTVTITIDTTSSSFAAGPHTITAKQLKDDQLSAASTPITVTFDPSIAAFPAIPAQTAEGNVPFTFNVQHPDEAQAGFKYELIDGPPSGLTITQSSGVMSWKPTASQVGTHSFKVRATDTAGNTAETAFTINITVVRLAQFSVIATNLSGAPITSIQKGQEFFLVARVQDLRPDATGVQAAFLDVAFDADKATVTGTIEHLGTFTNNTNDSATAGQIDEVGGESTDTSLGSAITNLFRIRMRADETGELNLSPNLAETEDSTARVASSSGATTELDADNISFLGTTLNVLPNFTLVDETFNVDEDSSNRQLDVLRNATKPTGSVLTLDAVGTTNHGGTVSISGNKVIYTPAANFFGEETFTYTAKNEDGDTLTANVTVEVANVNDPPTAVNDTANTPEDPADFITINVLQNDSFLPDPSETLTIKSVSTGSKGGTIQIDPTNTVIRYRPPANFSGTETFTYVVQDGHGGEATGTVTVTITPTNDNPTAVNDTIAVNQNVSNFVLNVLTNDKSDPDTGETLTITSKTNPSHGTVVLEGGQLKYTPTAGFRGADQFTYTISDGNGGTATATVNLQVATSNVPPNANNDSATTKRGVAIDIDVLKNDNVGADTGETLTITAVTQPANGVTTIVSGKVHYVPRAGFTGTDTFTYTIKDDVGTTDTATVTVSVSPIAPSDLGGFVFLDLNNNGIKDATEPALSGVTITLSGKDQAGTAVNKTATTDLAGHYQIAALDPGDYTLTQSQPAFMIDGRAFPGAIGTATSSNTINVKVTEGTHATSLNFSELGRQASTFKLSDLFGSTSRNSILASIRPGQAASFIQLGGTQWSGFQSVNINLAADKSNVTINAVNAAGVKVRGTAPVTTNGLVRIISTVGSDNLVRLYGGPAAFNLQPVANVTPSFTKGTDRTALEDAAKVTVATWATNISSGAADETDQTVSFTVTADKPELFEELPAVSAEGTLTFKPKANANGLATVTVVAKDSAGASSAAQTFTITITAVNDVPSFTKGADQTVGEDDGAQSVTGWATAITKGPATATDEANQALTFNVTSNNPGIFLVAPAIDATGKLTYTPKPNSAGVATVAVTLTDSGGTANGGKDASTAQTFTITITGSNDPPVAVADPKTTTEGAAVTINVLANDTDPDGDTLTVNSTLITPPTAAMGTAVVNADKTITYTPAADFSGTATFTYQLEDGEGGITPGTVTVTVTNVNDAPVAIDDPVTTAEDTPHTFNLITNDTDADDDDLTVTTRTEPAHGTLSATDAQGAVTYTPDDDFVGTDTFTYTISDGHSGTDTATVTITVTAKNDAPVFVEGEDQTVDENSGAQTVADWATDIAAGPDTATDEASQTLTFEVTTDNDDLFEVLPEIDADGTLTYTPADDATGTATVTVKLKDNGGTANGGQDTSVTKTFTITVEAAGALADESDVPLTPEVPEEEFAEGVDEFMTSL